MAAYDEMNGIETYKDPWRTIIAKKKEYHGIRVRGDKKNVRTYAVFADKVAENWEIVTHKCKAAMRFDNEIKRILKNS